MPEQKLLHIPYGAGNILLALLSKLFPSPTLFLVRSLGGRAEGSPGRCDSFRLGRTMPLVALVVEDGVGGGSFCPGSLLVVVEGDAGTGDGLVPLTDVCM